MSRKLIQIILLLCCFGISVMLLFATSLFRNDHTQEILRELYPDLSPSDFDISNVKVKYQNQIGRERHVFVSFNVIPKANFYQYRTEQVGNLIIYRVNKVDFGQCGKEVTDYEFTINHGKYEPISKLCPISTRDWITQKTLDDIRKKLKSNDRIENIVILDGELVKESQAFVEGVVQECRTKIKQSKERLATIRGKLPPLYERIHEALGIYDKIHEGGDKREMAYAYAWQTLQPLLAEYNDFENGLLPEREMTDNIDAQLVPYKSIYEFRPMLESLIGEIDNHRKQLSAGLANHDIRDFLISHVIPCIQYRRGEQKRLESLRKKIREKNISLQSMKVEELSEQDFSDMQKAIEEETGRLEGTLNKLRTQYTMLPEWNVIMDEKEHQTVKNDISLQISEFKKLHEEVGTVLTKMKSQSYFVKIMAEARELLQRYTTEFPDMEKKFEELDHIDVEKVAKDATESEQRNLGVKIDRMRIMAAKSRALDGCLEQFDSFNVILNSKIQMLANNIMQLKNYADNSFSTREQKEAVLEMGDKMEELVARIERLSQKTSASLAYKKEVARKESQKTPWDEIDIGGDNNEPKNIPPSSSNQQPKRLPGLPISPTPPSGSGLKKIQFPQPPTPQSGSHYPQKNQSPQPPTPPPGYRPPQKIRPYSVPVPDQNGKVILDFVK